MAWKNANTDVGPTKRQPRFLRSFDMAIEAGEVDMVCGSPRSSAEGSQPQTYDASDPCSSTSSSARPALLIAASILPRCRTMPASASSRSTSRSSNAATFAMSKSAKAARNAGRLTRMVRQDRPDWKPSRQSFSNRRRSSTTGKPHSVSW
jgi:hypothetical protein